MTTIDISEEQLARESAGLLQILLKDRTTKKNIVWATHSYELLGKGFAPYDRITTSKITGPYADLIQPRSEKSQHEQKDRTKVRAEVFTPTWLVEQQNGYVEAELASLSLEDYVNLRWLEITCGEAPYMVTRYDTVTGEEIALSERVGFVDRKLQRISREIADEVRFYELVKKAYQASYGYEYQGDSLLLARENLLATFEDYYEAKCGHKPSLEQKKEIATIISYNVFQMDGLKKTSPHSANQAKSQQLSLFEEETKDQEVAETPTQIKDWKKKKMIGFERLSNEECEMKFDVVIGNPPYQEELQGTSDKPIYNLFMDESYKLADKSVLITPARFLFKAGKTPKAWNEKMLADEHLKVIYYEQKSGNVFPGTDIKGGVAISYHDSEKIFGAIKTYTPFPELNEILQLVINNELFQPITSIIHLQNRFNLDVVYADYPELRSIIGSGGKEKRLTTSIFEQLSLFTDERQSDEDVKILGLIKNKRQYKYINKKYLEDHQNLDKYKVILPKSNGSGSIGEVLSTPLVGTPLVGYTQSFISFGAFDTREEAENCLKYIKVTFSRLMLGTLKITQDNNKDTWQNVPWFDFSQYDIIDWSLSIPEIDEQLFKLFNFRPNHIAFCKTNIQKMD
ncbi:Eco57I restriction-modification methylase domain-containing protein [Streptococcus sp. DD13]|uniref:Eco57I restriction-modification methylase domain-containing protein n=1 Tax=Streptococcus sp. DD13 TaxID=1777881 RepID=UPI00079894B4|nr:Eco57I restriction-modification methylase domain-containing protein [Streptococcus sp. DD13]KXT78597.1 Type II restriction endonuclease [Streptococcus sp. DD13]